MLQALLHSKLKDSFENPSFRPSEDTLTSSVFGILQYLPDDTLWNIVRNSCGEGMENLPETIGEIEYIDFWPQYRGVEGTTNSSYVEPDVLLVTESFYVIIEAKKYDGGGQYLAQWKNEIRAINNEDDTKEILFVAMGGNSTLMHEEISVELKNAEVRNYIINRGSWFNLLNEIQKIERNNETSRLVNDVTRAMNRHGFVQINWLDSLMHNKAISTESIKTINRWKSHRIIFLEDFNKSKLKINTNSINTIWNPIN